MTQKLAIAMAIYDVILTHGNDCESSFWGKEFNVKKRRSKYSDEQEVAQRCAKISELLIMVV